MSSQHLHRLQCRAADLPTDAHPALQHDEHQIVDNRHDPPAAVINAAPQLLLLLLPQSSPSAPTVAVTRSLTTCEPE